MPPTEGRFVALDWTLGFFVCRILRNPIETGPFPPAVPIASFGGKLAGIMSEKVEPRLPVGVVALRAESYSADDGCVVISLRTKFSAAERSYSIPVECLQDLIVDLRRLSSTAPIAPSEKTESQTEPLLPLELPVAAE
jgi:hypothetical protein